MRISWRKPNALKGASQRSPNTLKTPAGNTDWYKKWYGIAIRGSVESRSEVHLI